MLCAGVVLPHPPLLVPEVAGGAAAELDGLRDACIAALSEGLAAAPDRIVLVGTGEPGRAGGGPSLAPYGLPGPADAWPLSLTIGSWLLDHAGWAGDRLFRTVAADATAAECAAAGAEIAGQEGRALLVAVGDGSARRSLAAPGHLDPRAEAFDAVVSTAFGAGDGPTVLSLNAGVATELMVAGRAPWQVFAGAFGDAPVAARLHYEGAPYGVGYFVACWCPAP